MDLHSMSTVLGLELRLLIFITLGSIVGFFVELSTSKNKANTSILFFSELGTAGKGLRVAIFALNILVGAFYAYATTPFIIEYLNVKATQVNSMGFLLGMASLPLVRGYSTAMKNKKRVTQFIFNVIDLIRGGK